jgi:GNAT superfamily N-acetyltransferase
MTMPITVRRARASDLDAIMPLVLAMIAELAGEKSTEEMVEQITAEAIGSLAGAPDDGIFVALRGEEPVGCGRARVLPYHPLFRFRSRAEHGYIEAMYVPASARRQGVGGMLVRAMEAWLVGLGTTDITLHYTQRSHAFYESMGYELFREMYKRV